MLHIGFYIKWDKFSLQNKGNVVGDELLAQSLCKAMSAQYPHIKAETYAPNFLPKHPLDVIIYLNDVDTLLPNVRKNILYFQNGFPSKEHHFPLDSINAKYDGLLCFSQKMLDVFKDSLNVPSLFLPFGVDTSLFYPRDSINKDSSRTTLPRNDDNEHIDSINPQSHPYNEAKRYECEVAYIGNDIKGEEATMAYLYPALDFDFGLFGNWRIPRSRFKIWKNFRRLSPYQKPFERISRGKIPQEWVPYLYSQSKINLNCTLQSCIEWDVITLRTLEILACRGFCISDKVPSALTLLKDGIVFTDGGELLKEQIAYYLAHEDERKKIAQKGYEYVVSYCTIDQRTADLMTFLQKEIL